MICKVKLKKKNFRKEKKKEKSVSHQFQNLIIRFLSSGKNEYLTLFIYCDVEPEDWNLLLNHHLNAKLFLAPRDFHYVDFLYVMYILKTTL